MKEKDPAGIVPDQNTGKPIDTSSSITVDAAETKAFFDVVKQRLQDVNQWNSYAGSLTAKFQLVDENGNEADRAAQKGDYFKIDIPGPGNESGDGYDWVQIEEVESASGPDMESFGFRVRPASSPQNKKDDTAHFYSPESTSSFTVIREKNKVTVAVYDRNTKANTKADTIVDKVRNAIVGSGGILAFSKIQWKSLTDGLLDTIKK